MKKRQPCPFNTEVDLCNAFLSTVPPSYVAYPETEGWDIVLVRKIDGLQIGIQAKLRMNEEVIEQTLRTTFCHYSTGPDCRAVLVPFESQRFSTFLSYAGVVVITVVDRNDNYGNKWGVHPQLPHGAHRHWDEKHWPEWFPVKRLWLPDYLPDVDAGASSPRQLSAWKIKSLKILAILEKRGFVQRGHFKALQLSPTQWCSPGGWLDRDIQQKRFIRSPRTPDLAQHHPKVWPEILATFDDWMKLVEPEGAGGMFGDAA
jgi:hypothetical protein